VAPLALALLAVFRARAHLRDVALFAVAAAASLGVFLGTPLLDLAWAALPGFRYSRPDRVVFVYMAAVAVLAAHGLDAAAEAGGRRSRRAWAVALGLAALIAAWAAAPFVGAGGSEALARWTSAAAPAWRAQRAHLMAQAAVAVLATVVVWLWARRRPARPWLVAALHALVVAPSLVFGWRFHPAQPRPEPGRTGTERTLAVRSGESRFARVLAGGGLFLPPNLTQLLGLADAQGSSAAGLAPYVRLVQAADPGAIVGGKYFLAFREPRVAATPLLSLLSVEWVASDAPLPLPRGPAAGGKVTLFRNPGFLPRFHVVPRAEAYDDVARARARLLSPGFDPRRSALVPAAQAARLGPVDGGAAGLGPAASLVRYEPHEVEVEVDSSGGVLVSSEAFYPGWDSFVDGRRVETLLVNTAFRGAAVPAGRHRVTMRYVPRSFVAGLVLSGAALAVTLIALRRRA
jgi:hypothetical protein